MLAHCACAWVLVRNGVAEGRIPLSSPISPYFVTVTEELMPLHTSRLGSQSSQCWEMWASLTFRTQAVSATVFFLTLNTHLLYSPVADRQAQALCSHTFLSSNSLTSGSEPHPCTTSILSYWATDAQPWNVSPGIWHSPESGEFLSLAPHPRREILLLAELTPHLPSAIHILPTCKYFPQVLFP